MKSLSDLLEPQLAELNRQLAPLRTRFEALQPREQIMVAVAALVVTLALIYLLLWQPFALMRARHATELDNARSLAARIELVGAQAQQSHPAGPGLMVGSDVSLLSAVDMASKDGVLGKPLSRVNPDGDNQVRVWVEDVQFDTVVRWMDDLQSHYGVHVDNVAIERRPTAGSVNVRMALVRGQ